MTRIPEQACNLLTVKCHEMQGNKGNSLAGTEYLVAGFSCLGAVQHSDDFCGSIAEDTAGGLGRVGVRVALGQDDEFSRHVDQVSCWTSDDRCSGSRGTPAAWNLSGED